MARCLFTQFVGPSAIGPFLAVALDKFELETPPFCCFDDCIVDVAGSLRYVLGKLLEQKPPSMLFGPPTVLLMTLLMHWTGTLNILCPAWGTKLSLSSLDLDMATTETWFNTPSQVLLLLELELLLVQRLMLSHLWRRKWESDRWFLTPLVFSIACSLHRMMNFSCFACKLIFQAQYLGLWQIKNFRL